MAGTDVIEIPWAPGQYAVRDLVERLDRAGRFPINSAGRLKSVQQKAWDAFQNGTGSPADDPNRPNIFPLAHVRFGAADIDPTAARVKALEGVGLRRPYAYEPWHWELPNIRNYPLVESLPTSKGFLMALSDQQQQDMYDLFFGKIPRQGGRMGGETNLRAIVANFDAGLINVAEAVRQMIAESSHAIAQHVTRVVNERPGEVSVDDVKKAFLEATAQILDDK